MVEEQFMDEMEDREEYDSKKRKTQDKEAMTNKPESSPKMTGDKPAFPLVDDFNGQFHKGMTLFEYASIAVMQGIRASKPTYKDLDGHINEYSSQWVAERSIEDAQALIEELQRREKE